jgi:DNA-binding transcriptional regulator GbsR (MarR family)
MIDLHPMDIRVLCAVARLQNQAKFAGIGTDAIIAETGVSKQWLSQRGKELQSLGLLVIVKGLQRVYYTMQTDKVRVFVELAEILKYQDDNKGEEETER